MKKESYLAELAQHIRKLPETDRQEILADYEAHFEAGREAGKSDQDIARGLGAAKAVAQEIMMNTLVKQMDEAPDHSRVFATLGHVLLMILVLAPLNFFMLVCPFLILFSLVLAGWVMPLTLGALAVAAFGFFFRSGGEPIGMLSGLSFISMFLGTFGVAALTAMVMVLITRASFQMLFSFFRWNLDFIQSRRPATAATGG